jgi:hypothetical protein
VPFEGHQITLRVDHIRIRVDHFPRACDTCDTRRVAHADGHFNFAYLRDGPGTDFPNNVPREFDWRFGWVQKPPVSRPLVVGEWGGVWKAMKWNGRWFRETSRWQKQVRTWLSDNEVSSFYWVRARHAYALSRS